MSLQGSDIEIGGDRLHVMLKKLVGSGASSRKALFDEDGSSFMTFAELESRSNAQANSLRPLLTEACLARTAESVVVAIHMKPTFQRFVTIFATWKLGFAYLPLDESLPIRRIKQIVRDCNPVAILHDEYIENELESDSFLCQYPRKAIGDESGTAGDSSAVVPLTETDAAVILYTSGSTGTPKGVILSHRNLRNRLSWYWHEFPLSDADVGVAKTSFLFVDSITESLSFILKGNPLVVVNQLTTLDSAKFNVVMNTHKVTRLVLVPSLLRNIVIYKHENPNAFDALQLVVSSGETLSKQLAEDFFDAFRSNVVLANFYGSTETTGDILFEVFRSKSDVTRLSHHGKLSIGRPIQNCSVEIQKTENTTDESGEILLFGLGVCSGFQNSGHECESIAVRDGHRLLRTGDFGEIVDNRVIYIGRVENRVKIRGNRIDLSEVESVILSVPEIREVKVLCIDKNELYSQLVGFYVAHTECNISEAELEDICRKRLPSYMVPRCVAFSKLPHTNASGKVDKHRLMQSYQLVHRKRTAETPRLSNTTQSHFEETQSDLQTLLQCVAIVLDIPAEALFADRSFYANGGDSLSATCLISSLRHRGISIDLQRLLMNQPLSSLLKIAVAKEETTPSPSTFTTEVVESLSQDFKECLTEQMTRFFHQNEPVCFLSNVSESDLHANITTVVDLALSSPMFAVLVVARNASRECIGAHVAADCCLDGGSVVWPGEGWRIAAALEQAEASTRKILNITHKGEYLDSQLEYVDSRYDASVRLHVALLLEKAVITEAQRRGYRGILSANTSVATQEIATSLGYETRHTIDLRDVVVDGVRIFNGLCESHLIKCQLLSFSAVQSRND